MSRCELEMEVENTILIRSVANGVCLCVKLCCVSSALCLMTFVHTHEGEALTTTTTTSNNLQLSTTTTTVSRFQFSVFCEKIEAEKTF